VYHSTLGWRVIKKKKKVARGVSFGPPTIVATCEETRVSVFCFFFTLVTGPRRSLSLKLSDTRVHEGIWLRVEVWGLGFGVWGLGCRV